MKSEAWLPSALLNPWDKRIPFEISTHFTLSKDEKDASIQKNIAQSLTNIEQKTCLSFEAKNCRDTYYVFFEKSADR